MMQGLARVGNFIIGSFILLLALAAIVILLPLVFLAMLCLFTPSPIAKVINLVFPIFLLMGPDGARTCLDKMLSFMRFLLDKATGFFRMSCD
jgi:hypothetical protein